MLILGHRGARKYAPENSIPAFKKAVELGLDGVEFDVMSTLDSVPIVIHDDNLQELTGRHMHIHKTPYAELNYIDIGSLFSPYFSGEKIPTFKEVLDVFRNTNLFLNIELKHQPHQNGHFIERVFELLEGFPNPSRILISSFNREILYKAGRIAPQINRALLIRVKPFFFVDAVFFANILAVHGINPHIGILNKYLVRYARLQGWKVITWTANDPEEIRKAISLNVDGIITDEPMLAREILKNG